MIQRRMWTALLVALVVAAPAGISGGHALQGVPSPTRAHLEALASPRLEGRLTGSDGERLAGDYLVSQLEAIGAKPLPGQRDYRLAFQFTAGTRDGGSSISVVSGFSRTGSGLTFAAPTDIQALSFSDNAEVTGPVVFAGYGIVVPEAQNFAYDSYAGLDVKDKVVAVLRYFPEDAEQNVRAILARYSDLRYKAMAARQRGAKAMVVVTGPRSPNAGQTIPMSFDTALAGSGIVAASVSAEVGNAIFLSAAGRTLPSTQQELDSGNPHVAGFALPAVTVSIRTIVQREQQTARNIVAYLPATGTPDVNPKPWVALGAHYDHLGDGRSGNSLARNEETGRTHVGADDNASGSAAVLAVGAALASQPRTRHVLLAFWSGEELGLLGSNAFVANPPIPLERVAAYLNFDMVGRMRDNKLTVQAVGTSPAWARIIEQANVMAGFDLQLQQDPYQPTDVATFNGVGVPCLNFFTGVHADYHRPTDTAEKIEYGDLDRVIDFATAVARRVADADQPLQFTKVDQQMQTGGRAGIRVFTGTIPDYSTEAKGLLLSGVLGGGPAELAGLQKGDVIVEIAGQAITNIYDYTYALEVLKVGEPAKVVYLRNGQRRETTLTPSARR